MSRARTLLPYLDEADVTDVLGRVAAEFPGARLAFDTCGRWIIAHQDRHDTMRKVQARMVWACDGPRAIERWAPGLRLRESRTLAQLPRALRPHTPVRYRMVLPVLRVLFRKRFATYKVNLFAVQPS